MISSIDEAPAPNEPRGVRTRWLNTAAVITWLVCGLPPVVTAVARNSTSPWWPTTIFFAAFLLYGATLVALICLPRPRSTITGRIAVILVALQSITGLTMTYVSGRYLGGTGATSATLVIVAAELPYVVTPAFAWSWVSVQTFVLAMLFWRMTTVADVLSIALAIGGFQMFATVSSLLTRSEAIAREKLARANEQLHATRTLLAETSRVGERLRISRDLHDTLGHHLTALSLQLDVASHLVDGKVAEHVTQAHAITRLLLGDVRDVVSRLREGSRIDLAQAVRTLADDSTNLAIHVDIPDAFEIDEPRTRALLRCVQEIVTNTTRHATARNLWITVSPEADGVALHARDDGRGAAELICGHGLTGMRERFEEYAGRIEFRTASGRGFEVHAFMPRPREAL